MVYPTHGLQPRYSEIPISVISSMIQAPRTYEDKSTCMRDAYKERKIAFSTRMEGGKITCIFYDKVEGFKKEADPKEGRQQTFLLDLRDIKQCDSSRNMDVRTLLSGKCDLPGDLCAQMEILYAYCKKTHDNPSCMTDKKEESGCGYDFRFLHDFGMCVGTVTLNSARTGDQLKEECALRNALPIKIEKSAQNNALSIFKMQACIGLVTDSPDALEKYRWLLDDSQYDFELGLLDRGKSPDEFFVERRDGRWIPTTSCDAVFCIEDQGQGKKKSGRWQ
ncbi:hypothetical protein QR680_008150 [Steinernema hermaphroditum]|uniref:Uncharacterized protein n=1 Tax=Steinernema hermaphroditum TaxID=289476 RepID=A0AA39IFJ8_9BILA|nr:hypothetical protein QR680_008150 [Steinernema hermaphroditum]